MSELQITVNGHDHRLEIDPSRTLAHFLRYDLGLIGTKIGCEEAECGICTVLVDGVPVNSCVYPALKAAGKAIITIEGLADGETLHPLQQQFVRHGAVQCGFCTPGMMVQATHLLATHPHPDAAAAQRAIEGNLCRCTGYQKIVEAIVEAGAQQP